MVYWDFQDAQPGARCLHLHLKIPAVGLLAHIEPLECLTTNRAKRRHIRITNVVEEQQNQSGKSSGKDLPKIHTTAFALTAGSRADHEIVCPPGDRINKLIH